MISDEQIEVMAREAVGLKPCAHHLCNKHMPCDLLNAVISALRTTRDEAGREREDEVGRLREALQDICDYGFREGKEPLDKVMVMRGTAKQALLEKR